MSADKIVVEYLERTGGDMRAALMRMAHTVDMARCRAEDSLPEKSMSGEQLRLLWKDLHPNHQKPLSGNNEGGA